MTVRHAALVGIAAGAVALIAVPSALAAGTTYSITAGTHKTGSSAFTSKTTKIAFTDTTSKQNLGCAGGTATGSIKLGKVAAAKAAAITKTTWTNCTGPLSTVFVPTQKGSWAINATGATAKGVTKVFISNVNATVKLSADPSACTFVVTGSTDGTYSNATGKLALKPGSHKLKVSKETGSCFGLISKGDSVAFTASYAVKAADGKLTISS